MGLSQGLGLRPPHVPWPIVKRRCCRHGQEGPEKIEDKPAQDRVTLQSGGGRWGAWTLKTGAS